MLSLKAGPLSLPDVSAVPRHTCLEEFIPSDAILRDAPRTAPRNGDYPQTVESIMGNQGSPSIVGSLLTAFVEIGDIPTLKHSLRVSMLAEGAASSLGQSRFGRRLAEVTGLLHDIGKIDPDVSRAIHSGVPLTTAERTVVNEHALIGFKTIYETGRNPVISLRERCGTLMSEVALNTLFSHANTRKPESSGVDEAQIAGLVEAGIITPKDALSHYKKDAVLLVTLADATDALLSTGSERAYRASRLAAEGRTFQIDPVTVSDTIRETIDLGAIDVAAFVTSALERYPEVCRAADSLSLELSRRTRRSTSKLFN